MSSLVNSSLRNMPHSKSSLGVLPERADLYLSGAVCVRACLYITCFKTCLYLFALAHCILFVASVSVHLGSVCACVCVCTKCVRQRVTPDIRLSDHLRR